MIRVSPARDTTIPRITSMLLLCLTLSACDRSDPGLDMPGLTVPAEPITPPPFTLLDQDGREFNRTQLSNHWDISFFGYTHCPDVCPNTMVVMNAVHRKLQADPALADTRFVFFSVDPWRDTASILKGFVDYYNKDFRAVTGDGAVMHRFADALGVFYDYESTDGRQLHREVGSPPPFKDYLVNHPAGIYFFNPRGQMVAYLIPPYSAERIVEVYRRLRGPG